MGQTDKAWHPEEPFGAEHWKDSFDASLGQFSFLTSGYSLAGGTTILTPSTTNLANAPTYGYGINFAEAFAEPSPSEIAEEMSKWLGGNPKFIPDDKGAMIKGGNENEDMG